MDLPSLTARPYRRYRKCCYFFVDRLLVALLFERLLPDFLLLLDLLFERLLHDLRAVDLRVLDFLPALDLRAGDFRAADFLRLVDFFRDDDFFAGTLPPALRASDRPIAIACSLLFTFLPEPLFSVPRLRSCIARFTLL